ncbi:MAG: sodium/glutamate symporter [Candidatus Binatia bacterium]
MALEVDVFGTTTIAMCVFFVGYAIVMRLKLLRDYSIPESVVGGFTCAMLIAVLYHLTDLKISFDSARRDILLVYFFAALGLRSSLAEMISNGRPLLVLVALACVFIVVQNVAGIAIARAFNYDPNLGIVAGSMALTGRSGTTVAWAPFFEDRFGLENVSRLGMGVNMAGLIAACCIGGPLAKFLINRHHLRTPGPSSDLDVGISREAEAPKLDYYAFLLALLRIHIAIILGQLLGWGLEAVGVYMPLYVTCLAAGIALGNLMPRIAPKLDWPGSDQCLTLIAYVSLGLFYTMTFMNMQLWTAGGYLFFILVVIVVQLLLTVCYIYVIVFRAMGRDYEAAVISAGFAGIVLGSTATTMAIITAVARQHGRAHKAFVIIPLACGFFIDIANSFAIMLFPALFYSP